MVRFGLGTFAAMATGLLLMATGLSCGDGAVLTPASPTEQTIDPKDALRRAVDAVLQLESAAFTLEHLTGTTTLFPGLEMSKVFGIVDIPDRFSLTVEAESTFPRSFVEISIVTIEDQAYMTDVISGQWREVSQDILPFSFGDLGQSLADIIEALDLPVFVGAERLKDHDSYHISGRIQSEDLTGIVPGAGEGFDVELDLWLEQARSLLLQVLISGKVVPTDGVDAVRLLTLDDINVPVEISPPR
jgi:hypothetical protein